MAVIELGNATGLSYIYRQYTYQEHTGHRGHIVYSGQFRDWYPFACYYTILLC